MCKIVRLKTILRSMLIILCLSVPGFARELPKRIISLGPFITEEICFLGAKDRLVGITTYCLRPEDVRSKEKIGSIIEVNMEKIISLKPDLVLATPLSDKKAKTKMRQMGINLVEFSQVNNFEQVCEQMLELGRIIGTQEQAKMAVEKARTGLKEIKDNILAKSGIKVFVQIGSRPLTTANKDYFINDLIVKAGGINIAENSPGVLYSLEKIIENDPEVIIITTMGISGEKEKEFWQKYKTIKAVKNKRIYIVDSYLFCSPTPQNFIGAMRKLTKLLYGENHNAK